MTPCSIRRSLLLSALALGASTTLVEDAASQRLRHAAAASDVVVVGTSVGVQPLGKQYVIHTIRVEATLHGEPGERLSVVELKGVGTHQRPVAGERRLYCLRDVTEKYSKLPASRAPYFQMSGHPGSNPQVVDENDGACELARVTIASEAGLAPKKVADRLAALALHGPKSIRDEAVQSLTERPTVHSVLDPLQMSDLVSRAVGETEDIPFKIALCELCAVRNVPGLVHSLTLALDQVDDERFARALGRIARRVHGEEAIDIFQPHLIRPSSDTTRANLLLALGATSTERALEALLRMRGLESNRAAVDAALRIHGSPRAMDAIEGKTERKSKKK